MVLRPLKVAHESEEENELGEERVGTDMQDMGSNTDESALQQFNQSKSHESGSTASIGLMLAILNM